MQTEKPRCENGSSGESSAASVSSGRKQSNRLLRMNNVLLICAIDIIFVVVSSKMEIIEISLWKRRVMMREDFLISRFKDQTTLGDT